MIFVYIFYEKGYPSYHWLPDPPDFDAPYSALRPSRMFERCQPLNLKIVCASGNSCFKIISRHFRLTDFQGFRIVGIC